MGTHNGFRKAIQNRNLSKRYQNSYRQKLKELYHPKDNNQTSYSPAQIRQERERLRKQISLRLKYNVIITLLLVVLLLLVAIISFYPTLLFP